MNREQAIRSVEELDVSDQMKQTMMRLHDNLEKQLERKSREAQTVYQIAIPEQTLTVPDKDLAEHTLHMLKSFRVSGTYRVTRK